MKSRYLPKCGRWAIAALLLVASGRVVNLPIFYAAGFFASFVSIACFVCAVIEVFVTQNKH